VVSALYTTAAFYIAVNVAVCRVLSTPLTWPMLRATRGTLADSIRFHVTVANLLCMGLVAGMAMLLPLMLPRAVARVPRRLRVAAVMAAIISLPLGPVAVAQVRTAGLHRNALAALLSSALPHVTAADVNGDWHASPLGGLPGEDLTHLRSTGAGCSVVVVHLESTAAAHLKPFGGQHDTMPNLSRLAAESVLFENAYTTYPETIKSFFAVQCACWPSLDSTPADYAQLTTPGLASVLADHGYRTGLVHSGRFDYLGMKSVLRGRGYEVMQDAGDIGGQKESAFGIDEPSTVEALLRWLDEGPPGQPFLATYLPIAGHHPYETPAPGPFPEIDAVGRYHNALHYADEALGMLMDGLRRRGLYRHTLVVVLGDHGEAFGEHTGNYAHTLALYEENVRVPLLFAAPGLWEKPQRVARPASLVDVAPTVLDLLGLVPPTQWQGLSLLEPAPRLALFCTDYSLGLVGLRDGRWKLIHELESSRSSLFDLDTDPGETTDLAPSEAARTAVYRNHLQQWAAAQKYRVTRP
jgi:hypothetical protein